MLSTVSLADKLAKRGIFPFSLHLDVILTNLGRSVGDVDWTDLRALQRENGVELTWEGTFKTSSQGTATHISTAFDPSIADHSGEYMLDGHLAASNNFKSWAIDKTNAAKLWELSEKIVGEKFKI